MQELTAKQRLFVTEYLKDFNATRAAMRAGYKQDNAYATGAENLKKPKLKIEIQKRIQEIIGNTDKAIVENIRFWESIRDNVESNEAARLKASELLGKYHQMFLERVQHTTIDETGQTKGITVTFVKPDTDS